MKQAFQAGKMQWRGTGAACFLSLCLLQLSAEARAAVAADPSDSAAALDLTCPPPGRQIEIPDGATAAETELLKAKASVVDFDAATTAYTKCLADAETRLVALQPQLAAQLRELRADRNDAAVALAEQVVASFNEALRKYRERGITPPRISNTATKRELELCYPKRMLRTNVNVVVSISETGHVTDIQFPPAASAEIQAAVRCVVEKMVFEPATYNGVPVSSSATIPFKFGLSDSDLAEPVVAPTILSQPGEIAAAHDKCLPADLHEGGIVELALTISQAGRVVAVRTAISSGSDKVDQVAACVARTMRYTRPRYRGQAVEMGGIGSTIRVTPRAQDHPAATD
jgi:hypothetical protein